MIIAILERRGVEDGPDATLRHYRRRFTPQRLPPVVLY
jgi:hypothetical protein